MRNWLFLSVLGLTVISPVLGQEEAAMSSPILRATPESINLTASFSGFPSGGLYRLGVGTVGDTLDGLTLELLKGEAPISKETQSFQQGYAQSWFEVDEISVQGFPLAASDIPAAGEQLTLKVSIPRAEAERVKKVFLILAKHYDPDRWYIVEGAELDETYW